MTSTHIKGQAYSINNSRVKVVNDYHELPDGLYFATYNITLTAASDVPAKHVKGVLKKTDKYSMFYDENGVSHRVYANGLSDLERITF